MTKKRKIIVSGGGTGGHIYPAVAVAEALKKRFGHDDCQIIFVGADGKMEMTKIPALGYRIVGLPISGLQRRFTMHNLALPFKVLRSLRMASKLLRDEKPDAVVGFGGYASLPLLWAAQRKGIPTVLWEGNSFAGLANKMLAKRARKVCVSYDGMERFFEPAKIVRTGNPVRGSFDGVVKKNPEAFAHFGLPADLPVLVVTGGSLGARVINEAVMAAMPQIVSERPFSLLWQTGSYYNAEMVERMKSYGTPDNVKVVPFIDRMDYAYSIADLVAARSGASTVTELSLTATPALFVPSSVVAEDHQTKNAEAIVAIGGAVLCTDADAVERMGLMARELLADRNRLDAMSRAISGFAPRDAAQRVAEVIEEIGRASCRERV